MERADPSTMRIAASISAAFRSVIFCSAISRTCLRVTLPAIIRPGSVDPFGSFAAFYRKNDTGGVFIANVKDLSP